MGNFTPENAAVWFEIPVSDMKRAKAFYGAVLDTELKDENTGPNPMAVFPAADNDSVAGHLYPASRPRGERQHHPPPEPGAARGGARPGPRQRRQGVLRHHHDPRRALRLLPRPRRQQHRPVRP